MANKLEATSGWTLIVFNRILYSKCIKMCSQKGVYRTTTVENKKTVSAAEDDIYNLL